ncbi:MAG: IS1634 family transposase [Ruminococcus sp.]
MNAKFQDTSKGTWAYIQKKVRIDGRSTTRTIKRLGLLSDIQKEYGCADPRQWVIDLARKMTEEEKLAMKKITVDFYPGVQIPMGDTPLRNGADILLLPLYSRLGLPQICKQIQSQTKVEYNLNEILESLVMMRIIDPKSKLGTFEQNKLRIRNTNFSLENMYRALSLLSAHIDEIQANVWENSQKIMKRNTKVIYYDCTNYYFEIEDNDPDYVDQETGEVIIGLRKRGKSKENRPNPIVQMGLLMDEDGIPLSFIVFPGNESEQPSLQKIEEIVMKKFNLNRFIVSTDAGLASEDNRRFNMKDGRDYIAVQSLPSLPHQDQEMALDPRGWRIAYRDKNLSPIDPENPDREIFNLNEIDLMAERHTKFYKEIIIYKRIDSKADTQRSERVIVTYNHDFALYLKHKREERLRQAEKIIKNKQAKPRLSQQDARKYIDIMHQTSDGQEANKIAMSINKKAIENEARFDGFYAYGTSLEENALDVLKARSFHHEIEHLFRTTKTYLKTRPIYVRRQDRIRSHFLVCFLAMTILKMLQKQIEMPEISIDRIIDTLKEFKFGVILDNKYVPMFTRTELTNRMQQLANVQVSTQILSSKMMKEVYKTVKQC